MALNTPQQGPERVPAEGRVVPRSISAEMRESYLDYAMSVITARALPDVRDGLKPVHRRILFSMHELGLNAASKMRKSASVVGDVIAKYHPHGDVAVYDSLVKMVQPFVMRYPLALGQGNWGCFTRDTKVRLADGRNLSFEELIKEQTQGKNNYTFTVDNTGEIKIAQIIKPRLTRKNVEIMEVTIDNGEKIRCTLNHKFLLKDQTYVEAKDLKTGMSLMPLYTRSSDDNDHPLSDMKGYEMILQPLQDKWEFTHHLADDFNIEREIYTVSHGRVWHHVDFNKYNNSPDNIRRMHWKEHWRLHSNMAAARHRYDSEYVKKLAEGRMAFWADQKNRSINSTRLSERNKKNWQKPAYREQMTKFLSDVNKEYIQRHPEKREELSKRATRTLTRLWKNPSYRQFMHRKIIKGNKNHITNKTGKKKFDAICACLLSKGERITEKTYGITRAHLYPYGRATAWNTGLAKYYSGDVSRVIAEVQGNHKVRAINFLKQYEDVYDLTIPGTNNFSLAAGIFVHNSIDGDSAAAMRYSEAKMSRLAGELLRDLEKETVDFRPNYDNTRKEPLVLPSSVPNLLLNGTLGIAVGMASNIPTHNLREVIGATVHLIDNPEASTEDLLEFVKGPDFPTGGVAYNEADIRHAYANGKGGVVVRGEAEIVEQKSGTFQIIVTSIPYRVNKSDLIMSIADLVREKKLEGVKGLRDESAKDIRIAIDLKQGVQPQQVLNYIYKHTQLEDAFHYNMVALVDGVPETLSLKVMLEEFVKHRQTVVRRRSEFDLRRAEEREHILVGLKKALDHIDAIVKLIKQSPDVAAAHANLMKEFKFSIPQATAILEMKLQKLANLERQKIEDELKELKLLIDELKDLLGSQKKILVVIKKELAEIGEKYGDLRRTKIMKHGAKSFSIEDLVPEEESVLVYTAGGYVKRTNPDEYRKQRRGGVGVVDLDTKEEDFITNFLTANTHSDLLFFTDKGKVYQIKMYEVAEGRRATRGKSVMNYLSLGDEEKVTSILPLDKESKKVEALSLMMITKNGVGKRVAAKSFHDVRRSGIIAIKLDSGDALIHAFLVDRGDTVIVGSKKGQSIRFKESDVREMGRNAGGVRVIKLDKNDAVVAADVIKKNYEKPSLLVMSDNGYGKRTLLSEYKIQRRGGSGIKTAKVTPKTGNIMTGAVVFDEETEVIAMSKKSQVIRVDIKEIPTLGRSTQGVRVMKLYEGDSIASLVCL